LREVSSTFPRSIHLPGVAASRLRGRDVVWAALAVLILSEAILEVAVPAGHGLQLVAHDWVHDLAGALAALICLARVVADREDRAAWGAIAAGLLCFAIGQVLWSLLYRDQPAQPDANVTDASTSPSIRARSSASAC
jgi:hypothetical protein